MQTAKASSYMNVVRKSVTMMVRSKKYRYDAMNIQVFILVLSFNHDFLEWNKKKILLF